AVKRRGRTAVPSALVLVLGLGLGLGAAAPAHARAATTPAVQEIALLLAPHVVRQSPDGNARAIEVVRTLRPLTDERTALPVLAHAIGTDGATWLRVRLPGRPNSHTGWIAQRATRRATTPWHIVVERSQRRVSVYRAGHLVRRFIAIVGKPSTPTPRGEFFVEEAIALRPGDVGAPYALALSARSTVLQEFDGGPGQIALHGLTNVGGTLGTAVSHGCVRLADATMRWLVGRIGPGVPVTIEG
ncbi:MAG: hypothetical protein QOF75_2349, partial [Gaiellaceae bacterium]|nr:hypothetical protein [Gaiellaceae bacterium]